MKSCIQSLLIGSLTVAVFAMASLSHAQVNTTPNDSWNTDGTFNSPSPTLSQSTTGVTLGTHSLASTQTMVSNFWGPATFNLVADPANRAALTNATRLSYSQTLNSIDLNGGSGSFGGFAQSNELAITLFAPGGGPSGGLNFFLQKGFSGATGAGVSDSSGQNATWSGVDGTRTIVWDLTLFTALDPNTRTTKTLGQFLAAYPDISDSKIGWVEQSGGGAPVGPPTFFWDNVRLTDTGGATLAVIGDFELVPEPGSLVLLGLALPAVFAVARRARKVA